VAVFLILVVGSSLTMGAFSILCFQISGRRGTNRKGAISLALLLVAFCLIGLAMAFSIRRETRPINGLMVLISGPLIIAALVVAIIGWIECAKSPARYLRGKGMAISTVVAGGLIMLLLIPPFVAGLIKGATYANEQALSRRQIQAPPYSQISPPTLKFEPFGFVYHHPGPPWRQVDARTFGPGRLLALVTADPIFFTVACKRYSAGDPEQQHFADSSKVILQNETTGYELVRTDTVRGESFCDTHLEARANFQGHDYYYVSRAITTNDTGYYLQTWGPVEKADLIRSAAKTVATGFEVIPRRATKSP
jgi:MFS family permease